MRITHPCFEEMVVDFSEFIVYPNSKWGWLIATQAEFTYCQNCLLEKAGLKEGLLVSWIREIHEQLQKDLSQPSMEPPQKRIKKQMVIKTEELALVPVKAEPDSKVEPPLPSRDAEPYMSKQELMVVHNLKMLQKGGSGEDTPHEMLPLQCRIPGQEQSSSLPTLHGTRAQTPKRGSNGQGAKSSEGGAG